MKKIIIYGMIGLLLSVIIIATGLSNVNDTVELDKANKDALTSIGIIKPIIEEMDCDGTVCKTCMHDTITIDENTTQRVGAGCISVPQQYCSLEGLDENNQTVCKEYKDYSIAELTVLRDKAIEVKLNQIAEVTIARQGESKSVKVEAGVVTINEKK